MENTYHIQKSAGRSQIFRLQLRSCSKMFETGSGCKQKLFQFNNPTPVQTLGTIDLAEIQQYLYPCNDSFKKTRTPATTVKKWLRLRLQFFTNYRLRTRSGPKKSENPAGVDSDSSPITKAFFQTLEVTL